MRTLLASIRGHLFTLRCRIFRKNITIGKGLKLYKKVSMLGKGQIHLGINCTIGGMIGDSSQYVTIDTHTPDAVIRIGDNVGLYAARISAKYAITIGNNVLIEEAGLLDTDFHSIDRTRGAPDNENKEKCRIIIGDRVCIGSRSVISKGVIVGDDVKIIPGSLVTTSIKAGSIVCGNPAKIINI